MPNFMKSDSRIYVAGHQGLVGSAIVRALRRQGFTNLLLGTRAELDLLDANAVGRFFAEERPEFAFLAAAKVGGILADIRILQASFGTISSFSQISSRQAESTICSESCFWGRVASTQSSVLSRSGRIIFFFWSVRAYQPAIRHRQDRRHRNVLELQPPVSSGSVAAMPTNLYGPGDRFR